MRVGSTLVALAFGLLTVNALVACSGSELRGASPSADADADTAGPTDTRPDLDTTPLGDADVHVDDTGGPVDSFTWPDGADTVEPPQPNWLESSLGDQGQLADLVAVSATEAYAVGGGRVLRYNGRGWAVWGAPPIEGIYGVWAGDGVVVVVGGNGAVATRKPAEPHWTVTDTGVTATLRAVYGRAADDVWAFGDDTTVLHWDGQSWTQEFTLAGITLYSAWIAPGTSGREGVYAVGSGGQLVKYEAGEWRTQQIAQGAAVLHDIFGVDDTLFAVGTEATITVKKPTAPSWQGQTSNDPRESDLYAIAGRAGDDVVAFGADGTVIRYNGQKWTIEPAAGPQYASADLVSAAFVADGAEDRYLVVAQHGGGLAWSGTAWVDMPTRPSGGVRDFASAPEDHIWGVGRNGLMLTRDEQGWTSVPLATEVDLNAVDVASDGTVWAVGAAGTIVRVAADATISYPDSLVPLELLGVAAASDRVWICGKGGTLLSATRDGATVEFVSSGSPYDLRAATLAADGALWLVGANGTLLRKAAADAVPTLIPSGVGGTLNDVVATAAGVLAVGDNGVILDADASGATLRHEAPGLFLFGAAASGSTQYAVGWNGSILRRSNDTFAADNSGVNGVLQAVWTDGAEAVVGGRDGVLLVRRVGAP